LILIADASILIDLAVVGRVNVLPAIARTEVLDVVLEECDHPSQPTLRNDIVESGITVVESAVSWVGAAQPFRKPALSMPDALNLFYAHTRSRVLMAGDRALRQAAQEVKVEVHGTIWLVEQLASRGLVDSIELCAWLHQWPSSGRRLPARELGRLRRELGCTQGAS
jgi:predicted nucleic acid-binding protein